MQFEYIQSAARAAEVCVTLRVEKLIAHDCETTGLDAHKDKVILHSISTREKTYVIDTRDVRCLEAMRPILEDEAITKLGVNLDFDYRLIKGTAGIDTEGNYDLMLAEQALMAGLQKDGFSLEAIAKKYCKKEIDKTLQKSFIGHQGEFTKAQLEYAAKDTAELFDIADEMKKVIKEYGLGKTIMTECRALPAFSDITFYGQKINTDDWKGIMDDNQTIFKNEMLNLDKFFERFFDRDLFGNLDINYKSQPQILYGLKMMGIEVDGKTIENTNKMTQKKIQHLPVIIALQKYRSAKRILEAYGQNFLDAIHPNTGRIHPAFWQYGTATGRGAGRGGLNVLNIPRDKRFRHAFITDSDRLISTVDYSGAELRILAELSNDPLTVEGFLKGVDFHCYVAAMLFNREKVEKSDPIRQPTKTLNFGLAYGLGPNKLFAQLSGEGFKTTLEDCQDLFHRYKETFKKTIAYLDAQKIIARKNLRMVNGSGRHRRWKAPNEFTAKNKIIKELEKEHKGNIPLHVKSRVQRMIEDAVKGSWAKIERDGANFMIQSENVEWTKESMYEIRKELKRRKYDARFYNSVYDETVLDTPKSCAEEVHELQKRIMIECGQRHMKKVPVEVEGHVKHCWTK